MALGIGHVIFEVQTLIGPFQYDKGNYIYLCTHTHTHTNIDKHTHTHTQPFTGFASKNSGQTIQVTIITLILYLCFSYIRDQYFDGKASPPLLSVKFSDHFKNSSCVSYHYLPQ